MYRMRRGVKNRPILRNVIYGRPLNWDTRYCQRDQPDFPDCHVVHTETLNSCLFRQSEHGNQADCSTNNQSCHEWVHGKEYDLGTDPSIGVIHAKTLQSGSQSKSFFWVTRWFLKYYLLQKLFHNNINLFIIAAILSFRGWQYMWVFMVNHQCWLFHWKNLHTLKYVFKSTNLLPVRAYHFYSNNVNNLYNVKDYTSYP